MVGLGYSSHGGLSGQQVDSLAFEQDELVAAMRSFDKGPLTVHVPPIRMVEARLLAGRKRKKAWSRSARAVSTVWA